MARFKTLDKYIGRLDSVRNSKYSLFAAIICVILLIIIVYAFVVRLQYLLLGIPLWNDEALLAENIVGRTMREMLTPPLDNLQTAPALFLVAVKTLTLLFGTSEAVLRLFSLISFVLMLIAQGLLMRKVFRVRILYTLFSLAVSSVFLYFVQYSAELKPYLGDAAFVLISILSYYAYREGILGEGVRKVFILAAILIVCMLLSSPAVFAAGAVFVVEFVSCAIRRDKKNILYIVLTGIIFIIAFVLNYILWLKPIATDGNMVWYWSQMKFNFLVTSREVLSHNVNLLRDLLDPIGDWAWIAIPFAISGFVISLFRKNIYTIVVGVFFVLLLLASSIDKYPVQNRLWMFLFVIIFMYVYVFIDALRIQKQDGKASEIVQRMVPLILAVTFLIPNISFAAYGRGDDWTMTKGNQADSLIHYLQENIHDGEILYSYMSASPILKYKNGYETSTIGNVSNANIIYGSADFIYDVSKVTDEAKDNGAFILYYHSYYPLSMDSNIRKQMLLFKEYGFMEQIMNVDETYLYWFTDDFSKIKSEASLTDNGLITDSGKLSGSIIISNTGSSILSAELPGGYIDSYEEQNPEKYGRLYLVLKKVGENNTEVDLSNVIVLGELTSPLNPGEQTELGIDHKDILPGEYTIDLVSYEMFELNQLGSEPLRVTIK